MIICKKAYIFEETKKMIAIITGDIVNSRDVEVKHWMPVLKSVLNRYGKEPESWEIYRGDSFQMEIEPDKALKVALLIKSAIKQFKSLDVRMSIGIGEKTFQSEKITESNGSAFIYSGECYEQLKKQTLAIKTPWEDLNRTMNLLFDFSSLVMDNWTPISSLIINTAFETNATQKELAASLKKKQGNISASLKKSGFDEFQKLLNYYQKEIKTKC